MKALIIAAGRGDRLRPYTDERPKALVPLLGLHLIERSLLTAREAGIDDFVVVTGYRGDEVEKVLGDGKKYGIKIKYLHNREWSKGNGVSVLRAKDELKDQRFVLLMADHIFEPGILRSLKRLKSKSGECVLCVDRRIKNRDVKESTKVKLSGEKIVDIGKDIHRYSAIDCGIFICSSAIFEALEKGISEGRDELTDGVAYLAKRGAMRAFDIGGSDWFDIDTPGDLDRAERFMLKKLTKKDDGLVAKHLNRKLSAPITRGLVKTNITPNQVSILSFLIGIVSAFSFLGLSYPFLLLGGLLAQFCSVIDGVDGEIARLKFQVTRYGGYLDSILDRYADASILIAITYTSYVIFGCQWIWILGLLALFGSMMSMLSKQRFQSATSRPYELTIEGKFRYIPADRSARLFIIMLGGISNQLIPCLCILAALTNVKALYRLVAVKRMI